ncbi:MAG: hypothetical protein FWB73_02530 [Treponema sp.]|nr:hypothetical protein [Treponema sp.]
MKILNNARLLRITIFAGIILVFLSAAVLTTFYIIGRISSKSTRQEDSFHRILREYDSAISVFYGTEREYDFFNGELDRLEKKAISVESWLSVLKRRNFLSRSHSRSLSNYHKSINNALSAYPFSEHITAIAAAALVKNAALNDEKSNQLRIWLPLIADSSYNKLRLSLHVLLGDFRNPQRAAAVMSDIVSDGTESITVDLAILKILRNDYRAAADIQVMLESINGEQPADNDEQISKKKLSDNALRFAAEYYYDFGDLLRSAEVFSLINNTNAMSRQADALYLGGYAENAESIWNILANDASAEKQNEIALYNLAVLSLDQNEKTQAQTFLEKLHGIEAETDASEQIIKSRQFGLILYSRLNELTRAMIILRNTRNLTPAKFPYIDLEINKRNSLEWNLGRQTAETWLLLDRHPEDIDLHKWAAWHLFFQRRYDEIPILLDRLNMLKYSAGWIQLYNSLYLMNDGNLQEAEKNLLSIPLNETDWTVYANLGRIYEEIRSLSRALSQYELAASALLENASSQNKKTASRIQQRAAGCLIAQNQAGEAIRVLLNAVDLDPDNISARHELDRLMY